MLADKRILITGAAGQIALPIVEHLAPDNEVFALARFSAPDARERVEATGATPVTVDLAEPDWSVTPDQVDHVLHLAVYMAPERDFDRAVTVNGEGTGLLMHRYADASSFVVVSTAAVYDSPDDPSHLITETDPLGNNLQAYSPTYAISKIGEEAVARTMARALGLPTTIARMNVSYGVNGGLPAYELDMMKAGMAIPFGPGDRLCNPIHQDDINAQIEDLCAVASVPATIINWAGNDAVSNQDYLEFLAELTGLELKLDPTTDVNHPIGMDMTKAHSLIRPCVLDWRTGLEKMARDRHPDLFD